MERSGNQTDVESSVAPSCVGAVLYCMYMWIHGSLRVPREHLDQACVCVLVLNQCAYIKSVCVYTVIRTSVGRMGKSEAGESSRLSPFVNYGGMGLEITCGFPCFKLHYSDYGEGRETGTHMETSSHTDARSQMYCTLETRCLCYEIQQKINPVIKVYLCIYLVTCCWKRAGLEQIYSSLFFSNILQVMFAFCLYN